MKIAFIVGQFPSLPETFILNQITGLIDRGHEVDIYAVKPKNISIVHPNVEKYNLLNRTYYHPQIPSNYLLRLLKGIGLLLINFQKAPLFLLRSLNVFKYKKKAVSLRFFYRIIPLLCKSTQYDVIHCHFGDVGLEAVFIREIGAIQGGLVTSFHGYDINVIPCERGKNVYIPLFQKGDLFTVNSSFTASKAIALGCSSDKIVKLPVGVNISEYAFKQRTIDVDLPIKIITVARLVEKKGIEYSIKAVAKAIQNHPNILYRIVGDGPLQKSLNLLISDLGLSHKIQLLGWKTQDQVRELYDDSHIFILSSVTSSNGDQEGQGLVLQEAQAMGLPVLSTLHNGFPDSVLDGKSAFLVPERNVDALTQKLNYLIEHPETWAEMGQMGRNFVEEHYDINKLNEQLVEIYQQLLNKLEEAKQVRLKLNLPCRFSKNGVKEVS